MIGESITYEDFTVYPEYGRDQNPYDFAETAKDSNYHIITLAHKNKNTAVIAKSGKVIWQRSKHRLFGNESELFAGELPYLAFLNGRKVLPLICYELLFPEDYWNIKGVDLVIHMVGFPMYDINQKEAWIAIQKAVSLHFKCPVVCCCGGFRNEMNISRVVNAKTD